jgi:hypothetical protein
MASPSGSSMATPSKSCTPNALNASDSARSTGLRRASRTAIKPSRQRPRWCLGKKSFSRRTAATRLDVPSRCAAARWDPRQSSAGQKWLVVVSEGCARGYGAGRATEGSARGPEGVVGRSAASAAVGVAKHRQCVRLAVQVISAASQAGTKPGNSFPFVSMGGSPCRLTG